jgi:hypothetical protein
VLYIHPVFASEEPTEGGLYAVRFEGETFNSYEHFKSFISGGSIQLLHDEILAHWNIMGPGSKYFNFANVQDAIIKAQAEGRLFLKELKAYSFQPNHNEKMLCDVFEPLNPPGSLRRPRFAAAEKAKADLTPKMIRLYGIKLHSNLYVMTGWSLKYAEEMESYQEGLQQLDRLERVHAEFKTEFIYEDFDILFKNNNFQIG